MREKRKKDDGGLSQDFINAMLITSPWGHPTNVVDEIESTNDALLEKGESCQHGEALLTSNQSKGRGQADRQWWSGEEENLALSIALKPQYKAADISQIAVAASVGAAKAIEVSTGCVLQIKWPNDLVWNQKKVGGILIESRLKGEEVSLVVIGIGLNVNTCIFPEEIRNRVTSLRHISGKFQDINMLAATLILKVPTAIEDYFGEKKKELFQEYQIRSSMISEYACWQTRGDEQVTGKVLGFEPDGTLLLALDTGRVQAFRFGELHRISEK